MFHYLSIIPTKATLAMGSKASLFYPLQFDTVCCTNLRFSMQHYIDYLTLLIDHDRIVDTEVCICCINIIANTETLNCTVP